MLIKLTLSIHTIFDNFIVVVLLLIFGVVIVVQHITLLLLSGKSFPMVDANVTQKSVEIYAYTFFDLWKPKTTLIEFLFVTQFKYVYYV